MDNDKAQKLLTDERTRLQDLRARIDNVGDAAQEDSQSELSTIDQHPADVGSETFERTKELSVQEDIDGRLDDIEHALAKLSDGTYGVCEICGEPIPEERLEALPAARYCVAHQAQQERGVAAE
ncbi:MAG TPA: TraR/DksA C4-type zinc finger protein [Actinomycetota bacterium]|nr:TraR/DksA C4-type zinc finger protein [Actinomycetota bacterium]